MKNSNTLILGTWQFGGSFGYWQDQEKDNSKAVIKAAISNEITTFDTAYSYQNTETLLSSVLPKEAKLYTKIQPVPSFEKKILISLKRLKRESLEAIFIHWPTSNTPLLLECIDTLQELKDQGLCKQIGYSNFPLSLLKTLPKPDILQRAISLLWQQDLAETQLWCQTNEVKLAGYSPLAMGLLSGKYKTKADLTDNRQNYYALSYPVLFTELLRNLCILATKYNTTPSLIALTWARAMADFTIFGARNSKELKELVTPLCLTEEDLLYLTEQGKTISSLATMDNQLNHRWME